jgi:hypothetical protein
LVVSRQEKVTIVAECPCPPKPLSCFQIDGDGPFFGQNQ